MRVLDGAVDVSATTRHESGPVEAGERIQVVDVLRGFALLGILLVNMEAFSQPVQTLVLPMDPSTSQVDVAAKGLVRFLAESKFYTLFSFLFGLGLALQMERIESRGGRFVPVYLRRLAVLLGIGLVHALLIWTGDILVLYASVGFILVLFRKARPRTLLIWAAILLIVPLLLSGAAAVLLELGRATPEDAAQIEAAFAKQQAAFLADAERAYRVYPSGGFLDVTAQRAYDYLSFMFGNLLALGFNVLAVFLIGVYFGRQGFFKELEKNRPLFRRLLVLGVAIGLTGSLLYATLSLPLSRTEPSFQVLAAGHTVAALALSLAYMSGLTLLFLRPTWSARLRILAPVGQMALSNYLAQSIVCTLIFYGYGLGLFGKVGTAPGLLLALVIYGLQIPISNWWMQRFRFGPAEWLWRSLTYLRLQPMRR